MLGGVGEQRMPREQAQVGPHRACLKRPMVDCLDARIVCHVPAAAPRAAAEIDVFVVEKKVVIEPTQILEAGALEEHAAAGHPGHTAATAAMYVIVLAPCPRQRQAQKCLQQRWKRAARQLPRAVAIAEPKSHYPTARIAL